MVGGLACAGTLGEHGYVGGCPLELGLDEADEDVPGILEPALPDASLRIAGALLRVLSAAHERARAFEAAYRGKVGADAASLSLHSQREQGDTADEATLGELVDLNDAYEKKFGFRFVVFVAGRPKREILEVLRTRIANTREEELETGCRELVAIARDRWTRT